MHESQRKNTKFNSQPGSQAGNCATHTHRGPVCCIILIQKLATETARLPCFSFINSAEKPFIKLSAPIIYIPLAARAAQKYYRNIIMAWRK